LALVPVLPAEAYKKPSGSAGARSDDGGFEITFERRRDGTAGGAPSSGATTCEWSARRYSDSVDGHSARAFGPRPSPEHELWMIFCDGNYVTTRWLGPSDFGEQPIQPLIDRAVRRVLVGGVEVASRPNGEAVTGIPTLFWVEGFDGRPISVTEEAFGIAVTVTATLRSVEWDFGDGSPTVHAGLGEPWPERSSVRHSYEQRSPPGQPFVVTASIVLDTAFSVDGNPATSLPPITRVGRLQVTVGEIQAVRDR
jgi:hypothetical protein